MQLKIRKDTDEGIVEVDTGDGWRGLAPSAAREMADTYQAGISAGNIDKNPGTERFIRLLREYADDLEGGA